MTAPGPPIQPLPPVSPMAKPRHRTGRTLAILLGVMIVTCGGGCGSAWVWYTQPGRDANTALDQLGQPPLPGVTETRTDIGNVICVDVCATYNRTWTAVSDHPDELPDAVTLWAAAAGSVTATSSYPGKPPVAECPAVTRVYDDNSRSPKSIFQDACEFTVTVNGQPIKMTLDLYYTGDDPHPNSSIRAEIRIPERHLG